MKFFLLLMFAGLGFGFWLLLKRAFGMMPQPVDLPPFTPKADNDKVVFVQGWVEDDLKKILESFKGTYERDGYAAYRFQVTRLADDRFRLTFPEDIHPQLLIFLVNYIHYPFGFDLANRVMAVVGQSALDLENGFEGLDPGFGDRAILYVPKDDKDYDVLYMQTEKGISLATSFTDMIWKKVDDPRLSPGVMALVEESAKEWTRS
jgi:hypothetical protein